MSKPARLAAKVCLIPENSCYSSGRSKDFHDAADDSSFWRAQGRRPSRRRALCRQPPHAGGDRLDGAASRFRGAAARLRDALRRRRGHARARPPLRIPLPADAPSRRRRPDAALQRRRGRRRRAAPAGARRERLDSRVARGRRPLPRQPPRGLHERRRRLRRLARRRAPSLLAHRRRRPRQAPRRADPRWLVGERRRHRRTLALARPDAGSRPPHAHAPAARPGPRRRRAPPLSGMRGDPPPRVQSRAERRDRKSPRGDPRRARAVARAARRLPQAARPPRAHPPRRGRPRLAGADGGLPHRRRLRSHRRDRRRRRADGDRPPPLRSSSARHQHPHAERPPPLRDHDPERHRHAGDLRQRRGQSGSRGAEPGDRRVRFPAQADPQGNSPAARPLHRAAARAQPPRPVTDTLATSAHEVERRKRERYATLVLVELPRLRCLGFAFLSLGVYLNNRFLLGQTSMRDWTVITIVMAIYAAVSWAAQAIAYRRFEIDLTLFFLIADVPVWMVALNFSGGERSWLFFILFMRFADQTQTTFRRCLGFVSFGTFCYAAMLAWVAIEDGRPLDTGAVVAKLSFIFFGGVYIALSARTSESRRVHLAQAMHTQRELIGMLEEQVVALRDARARAEEASAAKSEVLANMSHEMRTPLHGILGMLQLAIDGERSPERVRQLEMARRSADGLLGTIEGILDFSRIEARRIALEPIYFSIRELVTDTVKALAVSAAEKGLAMSFGVTAAVPDRLWGDPVRLRQILVNLLGNAIKFTASGEIVVRVWCDAPEGSDLRVRFEVRDTGIGIEVTKQGRIFEPFEQAEGTRSRRFGGTGLGLSIVSRLVDAMGGSIDLESERGKGTVFRFDVLLAADEIAGDVVPEWERALEGLRVVVVEPNATARAFDGDMLRAHGIVPELYGSMDEATQPNIREAYGCVVADKRLLATSRWQPSGAAGCGRAHAPSRGRAGGRARARPARLACFPPPPEGGGGRGPRRGGGGEL